MRRYGESARRSCNRRHRPPPAAPADGRARTCPPPSLPARAGVTAATCWRRLERLRERGILRGQQAVIDWRALGYEVEVSLRFTLDKTQPRAFEEFIAAARKVPEVIEIQTFLGPGRPAAESGGARHGALPAGLPRAYPGPAAYRRYRGADACRRPSRPARGCRCDRARRHRPRVPARAGRRTRRCRPASWAGASACRSRRPGGG